jgi:vacuolar-type H+-ATPase subunit E/Vma4
VAIAELLRALERDADAEIRAALDAARDEAGRVATEAARARDDRVGAAHALALARSQAQADAALAVATRRARADVLTARAAMLRRLRDAARAALPAVIEARAAELGPRQVAAAIAYTGGKPGVLRCPAVLADAARAAAPPGLRVAVDPTLTGAVIDLDGGARIDASLDAILERDWPRLAPGALARVRAEATP